MTLGDNSQRQLQSFVERIERIDAQRADLLEDANNLYAEARDLYGLDIKAMRAIIRMRRMDPDKRAAHEALVELYAHALGMTPIEAAIERSRTADPPFLPGGEDE